MSPSRMLGATVMPHNLYLHSALVQTRQIGRTDAGKRTRLPLQSGGFGGGAQCRPAGECRHSDPRRRRFSSGTASWSRKSSRRYLLLAPLLGTAVAGSLFAVALLCSGQSSTLHRHAGGPDRDGRLPELPHAPLAAPPDYADHRHHPRRHRRLHLGRPGHLPIADPQPGDSQHAVALRRHSSDPLHQRPAPHGRLRQCRLGAMAVVGLRRADSGA